jgi:Mannosyltransferase putative
VREEITYKITYSDKESWWFGFELSDIPFTFENHYTAIAGYLEVDEIDKTERACSFTIAHTDENDKLLWYNGSLLKNKAIDALAFEVLTHWMMSGQGKWQYIDYFHDLWHTSLEEPLKTFTSSNRIFAGEHFRRRTYSCKLVVY